MFIINKRLSFKYIFVLFNKLIYLINTLNLKINLIQKLLFFDY